MNKKICVFSILKSPCIPLLQRGTGGGFAFFARRRFLCFLFLPLLYLFLCPPAYAWKTVRVRSFSGTGTVEAVDQMIVVKFLAAATEAQKAALHSSVGGNPQGEIPGIGWVPVRLPFGMSVEEGLRRYRQSSFIENVAPNVVYKPLVVPNDPLVSSQYGLLAVNAFAGWELETGSSNKVTIAVIDTGVDGTHPDLAEKIDSRSASFDPLTGAKAAELPVATDCLGHGTGVAGIAAASSNNGKGIAGISWGAKILSLRVFDMSSDSCNSTDDVAISSAIAYVVSLATTPSADTGRVVINMSLGGGAGTCNPILVSAVNMALADNIQVVAAAGNNGVVECPAKIPGVIAVGATDSSNNVASFSGKGPELTVTAPGVGVTSTKKGGTYDSGLNGTSFSSPHVAGLAALLLSALPLATTSEITNIITKSADDFGTPGFDNFYGWGKINVLTALRLGVRGTLSDYKGDETPIAFPNPFRVSSQRYLSFGIPQSIQGSNLEIRIYTMEGEIVRTIRTLSWDGKNDAGMPVASGVYIFRVKSDRGSGQGRVALIR